MSIINVNFVFWKILEDRKPDWTDESVKELLKQFDEKLDMLDMGIINTQKKLWQVVSKEMLKKHYYFTPAHCENKWKTLKRTYKSKQERIQQFGSSKRHCPFEKYDDVSLTNYKVLNSSIVKAFSLHLSCLRFFNQVLNLVMIFYFLW